MLVCSTALYGLRWALSAYRTQRRLAGAAAAGSAAARASVTQRPEANLLGIPNSAYGIAYYVSILALACTGRLRRRGYAVATRVATLAALGRSLTLVIVLARTRTWCGVCMRGHAANLALGVLLLGCRSAR